jgi:hypothetical protein
LRALALALLALPGSVAAHFQGRAERGGAARMGTQAQLLSSASLSAGIQAGVRLFSRRSSCPALPTMAARSSALPGLLGLLLLLKAALLLAMRCAAVQMESGEMSLCRPSWRSVARCSPEPSLT